MNVWRNRPCDLQKTSGNQTDLNGMHGMMISTDESDFMFTNAAWMIPSASGSLSAASSILIMSVILRSSPESRASAYHTIMFFMSFWDFITSIAMASTTIPMPSDVHEIYPFAGKAYGNVRTCEAQGFLILMGTVLIVGSISILMVYYVCTIRYGMAAERFKRRILPIMLAILIPLSTLAPTAALKLEYFNPRPSFNMCTVTVYPIGCDIEPNYKCIRGRVSDKANTFILFGMTFFFGSVFLILVSSLILVLKTIFDTEMEIRRRRRNDNLADDDHVNFNRTRAVLIEALMYFAAFMLTWVWVVISLVKRARDPQMKIPQDNIIILQCLFQPLQGFLNALIFIYKKAYALREIHHEELNLFQAIVRVIVSPSSLPEVTVMVSNLQFLELNHHQPMMENTNVIISPSLVSMSSDYDSISQNIPDNESAMEQSADFLPTNNNGSNGLTTSTGIQSTSHTTSNSQTLFPLAPLNGSSSSSLHDDMTVDSADLRPTSNSSSRGRGTGTSTTWSCGGHTTLPDIKEECDDHSGGSLFANDTI